MTDRWKRAAGPTTAGRTGVVVTPAAADLPGGVAKTIVMLAEGNVTLVPADNDNADAIAFTGVPAGWFAPFQVRRVTAATAGVAAIYG